MNFWDQKRTFGNSYHGLRLLPRCPRRAAHELLVLNSLDPALPWVVNYGNYVCRLCYERDVTDTCLACVCVVLVSFPCLRDHGDQVTVNIFLTREKARFGPQFMWSFEKKLVLALKLRIPVVQPHGGDDVEEPLFAARSVRTAKTRDGV